MKLWYNQYSIKPLHALNRVSHLGPREGALLKVEFAADLVGYADIHPHPELGDLTLDLQLRNLKNNQPSAQTRNSLYWALIDAHARRSRVSVFAGLHELTTHYTASSVEDLNLLLESLQAKGYSHFKVKMGRELMQETQTLLELLPRLAPKSLRLDFNGGLSDKQFQDWCELIAPHWNECLDYIEDPTPFDAKAWSQSQVPLALDRDLNLENLQYFDHDTIIFKPALSDVQWLNNLPKNVVFSTYMDHPLGEMSALYAAGQYYQTTRPSFVCGLRTWHLFEKNEFSEQLTDVGPTLSFPSGTGFGFDESLQALSWRPL